MNESASTHARHICAMNSCGYRGSLIGQRCGHLRGGHEDVEHAEVLLEAVADKDGARIDEVAQFEVRRLVRGQVVPRLRRVQVARHLPRHLTPQR